MIRVGSMRAGIERFHATLRGLRDGLHGAALVTVTPTPDARRDGGTNSAVLHHLTEHNPELLQSLDPAARRGAKEGWRTGVRTLATLAEHAGRACAAEIATRLRSGQFVRNLDETRERKRRAGDDTTPGMASGQLARALERANVRTER